MSDATATAAGTAPAPAPASAPAPAPALSPITLTALIAALEQLGVHVVQEKTKPQASDPVKKEEKSTRSTDTGRVPSPEYDLVDVRAEDAAATSMTAVNYVCVNCSRGARDTCYVITKGLAVGVFTGWHTVSPLVTGVRHACYHKCSSKEAALEAFEEAVGAGLVSILN